MDVELKRCPFCNGKAELLCAPPASGLKSKWVVICKNHCVNQYPHESAENAIEAWNRRVFEPLINITEEVRRNRRVEK